MRTGYFSRFIEDSYERSFFSRLNLEVHEIGFASEHIYWKNRNFKADSYFRVYYLTEGEAALRFPYGLFNVKSGNVYLIPANAPFRYEFKKVPSHYWAHFSSALMESLPVFRKGMEYVISENKGIEAAFERLIKLAGEQNISEIDLTLRRILYPFFRDLSESEYSSLESASFSSVIDYIDRHLDREIKTTELASLLKMNRNDFSLAFNKTFGIPPKQYICRRRVDRAKILLLRERLSVKEVAAAVGYDDEFYFYRIFKKYSGSTPDTFRKMQNPCL